MLSETKCRKRLKNFASACKKQKKDLQRQLSKKEVKVYKAQILRAIELVDRVNSIDELHIELLKEKERPYISRNSAISAVHTLWRFTSLAFPFNPFFFSDASKHQLKEALNDFFLANKQEFVRHVTVLFSEPKQDVFSLYKEYDFWTNLNYKLVEIVYGGRPTGKITDIVIDPVKPELPFLTKSSNLLWRVGDGIGHRTKKNGDLCNNYDVWTQPSSIEREVNTGQFYSPVAVFGVKLPHARDFSQLSIPKYGDTPYLLVLIKTGNIYRMATFSLNNLAKLRKIATSYKIVRVRSDWYIVFFKGRTLYGFCRNDKVSM